MQNLLEGSCAHFLFKSHLFQLHAHHCGTGSYSVIICARSRDGDEVLVIVEQTFRELRVQGIDMLAEDETIDRGFLGLGTFPCGELPWRVVEDIDGAPCFVPLLALYPLLRFRGVGSN